MDGVVRLKVCFGQDIRAFAAQRDVTFEELVILLQALFRLPRGNWSVRYKDEEGDMVALCSTAEWRD
eukprot:CAMPEP_0119154736 /NCGR_PEP_ID=MMETSP1310-20130426/51216_1 /TAXON_ID=464262 /ORGANISM="Genus nov. species nov., Strain RCC2339" /LENGTH=66 /DNA_ID=CAMNT_0007147289 /DNA_START=33 /DNA_END=230 /DNA_ORIENTATION=+